MDAIKAGVRRRKNLKKSEAVMEFSDFELPSVTHLLSCDHFCFDIQNREDDIALKNILQYTINSFMTEADII